MSALQQDAAGQLVNPFAGRDVNWLLDFRSETRGDHPFLVWEPFQGERRVWTYRQFRERVLSSGISPTTAMPRLQSPSPSSPSWSRAARSASSGSRSRSI
jgi:hypothetical protein